MNQTVRRMVLIDLSGTTHIESQLVNGVKESLERLCALNIPYRFVTNTTKESKQSLHNRLIGFGLPVSHHDIFTSLTAARRYVEQQGLRPMLFLEHEAQADFEGISVENPNSVVIGLAPSMFNYDLLTKAFNLIKSGADFVAINKSRYFQKSDGLVLGSGAFASALEYSTDRKALVIGKPEAQFFLSSIEGCDGIQPENCFMIGDDVRDDVQGAQLVGMKGILVKTGKYREGDEGLISPPPFHTATHLPAAIDHIISLADQPS